MANVARVGRVVAIVGTALWVAAATGDCGSAAPGSGGVGSGGSGRGGGGGGGALGGTMTGAGGIASGGAGGRATGGASGSIADAATFDAPVNGDVALSCGQLRSQADCDQRSDCHSVSFPQDPCACGTPGCCQHFDHCEAGAPSCNGTINCSRATPACPLPYAVQYQGGCFYGCVLADKCAATASCPLTAPSAGTSCGATPLACVYQDCAGAGRTQATCQGGAWSVQSFTCASIACNGGGTYTDGPALCPPGQICVHTTGGGGVYVVTPSCVDDTCAPAAVAISCIRGLPYQSCFVSSPNEIDCQQPSLCGQGQGGCQ